MSERESKRRSGRRRDGTNLQLVHESLENTKKRLLSAPR